MEPNFFRTTGTAELASRIRARRRNQAVAGLVVAALLAVGVYLVFRTPPGPKDLAKGEKGNDGKNDTRLAGTRDGGSPTPTRGSPPLAIGPGAATNPDLSRVPAPPGPPATAEQRKVLARKQADAEAKFAANDLLAARTLFNEIVDQGLPAADNATCIARLKELADKTLFSPVKVSNDPLTESYQVPHGATLTAIAKPHKITADLLQRINNIPSAAGLREGQTIKLITGPFNALVCKGDFTLSIYLDVPGPVGKPVVRLLVRRFKVGLGQNDSTPIGVWTVRDREQHKDYTHPATHKVIKPDDKDYPFGKLGMWMALEGRSGAAIGQQHYGIHSTNLPESIGTQGSLGCIRMMDDDVKQVWDLLRLGDSLVTVR